ncbi:MAG: class I SAM-dependent methyltransferase [Bacillota bacterium]|nr:class I SAM-dependent methyltransferase [Bacillota bacterium]
MSRIKEWTDKQILNYYLGVKYSDYPKIFWEKMKPEIAGCKTIIDIGCGPGAFALKAVEANFNVQAVDINKKSLEALKKQTRGLKNLKTIYGNWLEVEVEKSDAAICAYSFGGEIGTLEGIRKIIDVTEEAAFFIASYDTIQTDFLSKELYRESGIEPPVFRGNYQDLLQLFAILKEEVQYETVEYDFGMPLDSKEEINDCAVYLSEKLGLPSRELVKEHLKKIITMKNGIYWVPNPRKSTMIIWKRRDS